MNKVNPKREGSFCSHRENEWQSQDTASAIWGAGKGGQPQGVQVSSVCSSDRRESARSTQSFGNANLGDHHSVHSVGLLEKDILNLPHQHHNHHQMSTFKSICCQALWCMPGSPALQEAEVRGLQIQGHSEHLS